MEHIQLSSFQENLFATIEAVRLTERPILVTQNGKSLVKIVPVPTAESSWLGSMQGSGRIVSDLLAADDEPVVWDVLAE